MPQPFLFNGVSPKWYPRNRMTQACSKTSYEFGNSGADCATAQHKLRFRRVPHRHLVSRLSTRSCHGPNTLHPKPASTADGHFCKAPELCWQASVASRWRQLQKEEEQARLDRGMPRMINTLGHTRVPALRTKQHAAHPHQHALSFAKA